MELNMSTVFEEDIISTTSQDAPDVTQQPNSENVFYCLSCIFSKFIEYRLSKILDTYVPPVIITIGVIGNVLSIIVLSNRHFKNSSTSVVLIFLAVADNFVLCFTYMLHWVNNGLDIYVNGYGSSAVCGLFRYLTFVSIPLSSMFITIATLERTVAVCFPLKINQWLTKERMFKICTVATILVFAVFAFTIPGNFVRPSTIEYDKLNCMWGRGIYEVFQTVYFWVDLWGTMLLPCFAIIAGNIVIVIKLMINARKRQEMNVKKDDNMNRTTVIMLSCIGLLFLVTMLPIRIFNVGLSIWSGMNQPLHDLARTTLAYSVIMHLKFSNSALNFFVYCFSGTMFRKAFFLVMPCRNSSNMQDDMQSSVASIRR